MVTRTCMPGRIQNHPRMPVLLRKLDAYLHHSSIEAYPSQWSERAFFVPDILPDEQTPYIPAEFVAFRPGPAPDVQHNKDLVYVDSPFEIRVCGMSISRFDPIIPFRSNRNEIVMYSTQKAPENVDVDAAGAVKHADGVPFMHYDHRVERSVRPDRYYPIPASKSLVVRSGKENHRESVNVRFNVIEVDEKNKDLDRTLANLDQVGGALSNFSTAVPYLALLTPALSLLGSIGSRTLESYAQPDKVLNTDVDFKIAKRDPSYLRKARPGAYLRYGYFAFLAEPTRCKLYLSTNALRNMRLMVRRVHRYRNKHGKINNQTEYVPLKNCDYIIIRVTEPETDAVDSRPPIRVEHIKRLQGILSTASGSDPHTLKRSITSILREVGLQTEKIPQEVGDTSLSERKSEAPSSHSEGGSTDDEHK